MGFAVIARSPFLTGLVLLALAPTILVMPYLNMMPVFARDILEVGSDGLGLLLAATGTGTVVGALLVARSGALQESASAQFIMVMLFTTFVILFAIIEHFALAMTLLFLAGMMSAAWLALNQTAVQLSVDDEVRGRVLSVYMMTWGVLPVGQLFVGMLAGATGPGPAVVVSCLMSAVCVVLIRFRFAGAGTAATGTP
ncbi:MAG: MFS transporter [Thermomicrobiales bacterium]